MKRLKYLASATALALSISLMGCGTVATENNVPDSTESLTAGAETVNATESYVSDESLAVEPTEASENISEELTDNTVDDTTKETAVTETVMLEENLAEITKTMSPLTETTGYNADSAQAYGYTFSDMYEFMVPTATVNVRSLPSTDGAVIGSLSPSDMVTADGYCNETGWYRIVLSRTTSNEEGVPAVVTYGYVSNKYLKTLFGNEVSIKNNNSTATTNTSGNTSLEDGFRKDVAQEIWNLVNAERTANGIPALAWDEETYEYACKRAQEIVTDYSHNGNDNNHGENILMNYTTDANTLHMQWYNSKGHHINYMDYNYDIGACAVYVYNGIVYAVENFRISSNPILDETGDIDYRYLKSYTASNGVIVRIQDGGGVRIFEDENPGMTEDMKNAAFDEYFDYRDASTQPTPSSSPLTETPEQSAPTTTETYEPTPEQSAPTQTEPDTWTASNGVTVYVMNGNAYTIDDGYSDNDHLNAWLEYTQSH